MKLKRKRPFDDWCEGNMKFPHISVKEFLGNAHGIVNKTSIVPLVINAIIISIFQMKNCTNKIREEKKRNKIKYKIKINKLFLFYLFNYIKIYNFITNFNYI